jgi:hypothetical protein
VYLGAPFWSVRRDPVITGGSGTDNLVANIVEDMVDDHALQQTYSERGDLRMDESEPSQRWDVAGTVADTSLYSSQYPPLSHDVRLKAWFLAFFVYTSFYLPLLSAYFDSLAKTSLYLP